MEKCLDTAVYRIYGVCDKDNVSSLRTLLGLHGISKLVENRHAKFMDGLPDTGSAAIHCESKKQGTTILSITSPNVDRFSNFFH